MEVEYLMSLPGAPLLIHTLYKTCTSTLTPTCMLYFKHMYTYRIINQTQKQQKLHVSASQALADIPLTNELED